MQETEKTYTLGSVFAVVGVMLTVAVVAAFTGYAPNFKAFLEVTWSLIVANPFAALFGAFCVLAVFMRTGGGSMYKSDTASYIRGDQFYRGPMGW